MGSRHGAFLGMLPGCWNRSWRHLSREGRTRVSEGIGEEPFRCSRQDQVDERSIENTPIQLAVVGSTLQTCRHWDDARARFVTIFTGSVVAAASNLLHSY